MVQKQDSQKGPTNDNLVKDLAKDPALNLRFTSAEMHPLRFTSAEMHPLRFISAEMHPCISQR